MIISLRRYKIGVNTWDETNGLKVPNLLVPARGFWQHHNDKDWNTVPSQKENTEYSQFIQETYFILLGFLRTSSK